MAYVITEGVAGKVNFWLTLKEAVVITWVLPVV